MAASTVFRTRIFRSASSLCKAVWSGRTGLVKFLIVTHGTLADGFKATVQILMGKEITERIDTINAFVEGDVSDPKEKIRQARISVNDRDQLVIFTDVMFGSVNRFVMPYAGNKKIYLITGVNLPLLMEIVSKYAFSTDKNVDEDESREAVVKSKNEIVYVNDELLKDNGNEKNENDFFE